jgi:hypothetical protein
VTSAERLACARLQLLEAEAAVDGPFSTAASLGIDNALVNLERLLDEETVHG